MKTVFKDEFVGCSKSGPLTVEQRINCYTFAGALDHALSTYPNPRLYFRDDIYPEGIVFYLHFSGSDGITVMLDMRQGIVVMGSRLIGDFNSETTPEELRVLMLMIFHNGMSL